jgi:hypothetical protein
MTPIKNELKIFDEILNKGLRPWLPENNPDEKYIPMLSEIKIIEPMIRMKYEVDFIRPVNNKTKYYYKLIFKEMFKYCDLIISLISNENDDRVKKYWLNDTLDKKLKSRLKEIGKLIKERHLEVTYIDPKKTTFDQDVNHKTDAYIIQLLKACYIAIFLQIQDTFKELRNDLLIIEDFYAQLLFEPIPDSTFIKAAILPIEIEETVSNETPKPSIKTKAGSTESFCYKYLSTKPDYINDLFDSLKNNDFIKDNSNKLDFKKIFSGKTITNPVVWTGNISDLHYFIKLIHNTNKSVEYLKQHQWEVACKCFVCQDGSLFDRKQLKEQKKPKSTAKILEKIAGQLV